MLNKLFSPLLLILLIVVIALSACSPAQPGSPSSSLDGTQWNLIGFGSPDALTPPVENSHLTLDFADGQVSGSAGCNGYGASFTLEGDTISFSTEGFMTTLMFCEPAELMDQETKFLAWMQKAQTVEFAGTQLIIHTSEGDLTFDPAQPTALEGTNWLLSGLTEGDAVVSSATDENITIQFEGGQAAGSSGCNQFFAEYALDGEKLSLSTVGGTKIACEEEVALREATFLNALTQVVSYQIERSSLTLLDAKGTVLMSFYAGK